MFPPGHLDIAQQGLGVTHQEPDAEKIKLKIKV